MKALDAYEYQCWSKVVEYMYTLPDMSEVAYSDSEATASAILDPPTPNINWNFSKYFWSFQNYFNFFSFLDTIHTQKDFFALWAKNNLLLYTCRATCPFDPKKCFLEAYSTDQSKSVGSVRTMCPWKFYMFFADTFWKLP